MVLSNRYQVKTAPEQRACFICGKLSSSVFDSPDDFFFICLSHTKDQNFCSIVHEEPSGPASKVSEETEIQNLKREIEGLKKQLAEKDKPEELENDDEEEKKIDSVCSKSINGIDRALEQLEAKSSPTKSIAEPGKQYKLHASFLYLREQEAIRKEKWNLLKSLK